jgi:hypothetical protein
MAENYGKEKRSEDPRPRNEPTDPKEVSGSTRSGRGSSIGPMTQSEEIRSSTTSQRPRSASEKVGSSATPRTGATTGTSASTRSNTETRSGTRTAADESGMPKRTGPGGKNEDR